MFASFRSMSVCDHAARVALFLDQIGLEQRVDPPLDRGALVVALIDRSREPDELVAEPRFRFLPADRMLDMPQRFVDRAEFGAQRRDPAPPQCARPDRAEQAAFLLD